MDDSPTASADVTYTYRPSGNVQDRTFLGGGAVPHRYDVRERLERIGDPALTTYPFSARYAYHGNSTVSESEFYSAGSPATAKRYRYMLGTTGYDALNRLKSADFSSWSGSAWTTTLAHDLATIGYDGSGNLTTFQRYRATGTLIDNLSYAYTAGTNRLASLTEAAGASAETWDAEAGSFTYDGNGNVKTGPAPYSVTATTYDARNLATAVTRAGVTTSYRYNEGGWRIAKQVGAGNQELYIQDGPLTLAVFTLNASGTLVSWYGNVLAGARVVGRQPSVGNRSYYHTDLLGTTRAVVQGAVVVESYDYDPYGMLMPGRTLAGTTKEGFTSKERDAETGLDYFGARYYMGAVGRWTAVDPVADAFPQWNPYNYVEGNPAFMVDPFGLNPCPWGIPLECVRAAANVINQTALKVGLAFSSLFSLGVPGPEDAVVAGGAKFIGGLFRGSRAAKRLDDLLPTQDWVDLAQVERYVQRLEAGESLSPIQAVRTPDGRTYILDGHHRFLASVRSGRPVDVRVREGVGPVGLPDWDDVLPIGRE